jgi:hypothetical protein
VSRPRATRGALVALVAVAALLAGTLASARASTVAVSIQPGCGPSDEATEITATATGFQPGTTVGWRYPGPGNQAITGTAVADLDGRVTFVLTSSGGRAPGSYVLSIDDGALGAALLGGSAGFVVPCDPNPSSTLSPPSSTSTSSTTPVQPPPGKLQLDCQPPLGPPGFVTEAVGTGFPANAPVTLAWRPGIGGAQVVTDAAGSFRVPVLVMHHDALGPRQLVATVGGSSRGATPTVSAPFLVVPATLGPPRAIDPRLVFRQ